MGLAFGIFIFIPLSLWKVAGVVVTERRLLHSEGCESKDGIITNVLMMTSSTRKAGIKLAMEVTDFLIKFHLACYDNLQNSTNESPPQPFLHPRA